jgi:hypothetical protein
LKPFTGLLPGRGRPPDGDPINLPRSPDPGQDPAGFGVVEAAGFAAAGFDSDFAGVEDDDSDEPDEPDDSDEPFGAARESVR